MKSPFSSLLCLLFLSAAALAQQAPAAAAAAATDKAGSESSVISPQAQALSAVLQRLTTDPDRQGRKLSEQLQLPPLPTGLMFEVKTQIEMVVLEGMLFTAINGKLLLAPGSGCFTPHDDEFAAKLQRAQMTYTRRLEGKREEPPTKTPSPK